MKKLFALLLSCFIAYEIQSKEIFYFSNDNFNNIPVYFVAPEKIDRNSRLVIVMHGRKRNAEEYRDQWVQKANELNLVIVVPEFAEAKFPGVFQYNYGHVFLQSGEELPQNQTLFSLVEPLANFSLKKFKIKSTKWGIYGHGAGAHFVHRYILHQPNANHTLAIAANLGWYLSMTDQEWPFGLA
jgi:poly(3-hydroxybutyrate) depolymerase